MKSILFCVALFSTLIACGQADKSKRPSPPASVKQTLKNGTVVSIDYSQPSLKGRTIGKDVEPMIGQVWRAGANEATLFEISKDVKVDGQPLPAGKYALFMLPGEKEYTIIFNKKWDRWGTTYDQYKDQDVLKVNVKPGKAGTSAEKLTYTIDKDGKVALLWGDLKVGFKVE
jgi:hypothetical protein